MNRKMLWLLAGVAFAGCTDGPDPAPAAPRTVMVIDEGFDESLPVFAGKIVGSYTAMCQDDGDVQLEAVGARRSPAALGEQMATDDQCALLTGIASKSNPFSDMEGDRRTWNAAVRGGRPLAGVRGPMLATEVQERLYASTFHGTSTAGVIAQGNDNVRLVLVERALSSSTEVEQAFKCITQSSIDGAVEMMSAPEFRDGYLRAPLSPADRQLRQVIADLHVDVVSESFGRSTREALDELLAEKGCPPVELRPYFRVRGELEAAYEAAHPRPEVLVVRSAGNDGSRIDAFEDSFECRVGDPRRLMVGAYGSGEVRSTFSNYGRCVDVYGPGEAVVAPVPGDWLFPLSGTSFSAPLVARLMAGTAPAPFDAAAVRTLALGLARPDGTIPSMMFPAGAVYAPAVKGVSQGLTLGQPSAAARIDRHELDRTLRFLRLLGGLR